MDAAESSSTTTYLAVTKTLDGSSKIPGQAKSFVMLRGNGVNGAEAQIRAAIQAVGTSLFLPFLTEDSPETWYQFYMSLNEVLRRSMYGLKFRHKLLIIAFYAAVSITLFVLLYTDDKFFFTLSIFFVWITATTLLLWYHHYQVHQKLKKVISYWRPALEDDLACSVDLVLIKHNWALFCLPSYESYLVIHPFGTVDDSAESEQVIV